MNRRTYLSITTGACLGTLAGCTESGNENGPSENGSNSSSSNTTTNESASTADSDNTTENGSDAEESDENSSDESDNSNTENDTEEGASEEENSSEDGDSPDEENPSQDENSSDEGETLTQSDLETDPEAADAQVDSQEISDLGVNIDYSGEWSGIVGDSISAYPIDGSGPDSRTLSVNEIVDVGSIAVRKRDSGTDELTVTIDADGSTVAQDTTSDESQPASTSVRVD